MKVKFVKAVPPDYDPYEECCAGSHDGESVIIDCGHGLKIIVKEMKSGIGPSFYVYAEAQGQKRGRFYAYIDDDGVFCSGFEERAK